MRWVLFALLVAPLSTAQGQANVSARFYVPTVDQRGIAIARTLATALQVYLSSSDHEFTTFLQSRRYGVTESLIQALANDPVDDRLTFVFCVLDSCDALVRDQSLVDRFKLKVMNARLATLPLYLFTRAGRAIDAERLRVGYYVPSDHKFAEADLRDVIRANYGGARTIAMEGHGDGTLLGQKLWSSDYDVVVIYDEEPSPILDEMLREIDRLVQSNNGSEEGQASLWPVYVESEGSQLYRPSTERFQFDYVLVQLSDQGFLSDSSFQVSSFPDSMAAVVAFRRRELRTVNVGAPGPRGFEEFFPVILTNAVGLGWSEERMLELKEVLSNSYFSVLEQLRNADRTRQTNSAGWSWSSLPPRMKTVARTFLLNSHLDDPKNRYKILALREYDTITNMKRARLERNWLCSLGLLPDPSSQELAEWLDLPDAATRSSVRHDFNGSPIGDFRKAQEILSAPTHTADELRNARDIIVNALKLSTESRTHTITTGMWQWPYNPFYLLARIEASISDGEPRNAQVSNPCEN